MREVWKDSLRSAISGALKDSNSKALKLKGIEVTQVPGVEKARGRWLKIRLVKQAEAKSLG